MPATWKVGLGDAPVSGQQKNRFPGRTALLLARPASGVLKRGRRFGIHLFLGYSPKSSPRSGTRQHITTLGTSRAAATAAR